MEAKDRQRIFLSVFFFLSGFCFSSWASRIPTIKNSFGLNDAELGTILLAMPFSSMAGLPISGWLVTKYDSRIPLLGAFMLVAFSLSLIGFAQHPFVLVSAICLFAFGLRILNISINTQALTIQKLFDRKINGAFHGLWSTGGIAGILFCTILVTFDVPMNIHLVIVSLLTLGITFYSHRFLIRNDRSETGNRLKFGKPDPFIQNLGLLVFFAALCEGGMFDWSGIFFREIVKEEIFTLGYLIFMVFMSLSRFLSDRIAESIGVPRTYLMSATLIFIGICLALIFPSFWPVMLGFSLVGFGTAAVIPMTYTLAGTSKKYSPGMAISIIVTYGIVGMLIGPPLIGYLSHAFNLKVSFITFAVAGLMLIPVSRLVFKYQGKDHGF